MKTLIRDCAIIIIAASALGVGWNIINPQGYSFTPKKSIRNDFLVDITEKEARIKKDSGAAVFIDAREEPFHRALRIPGSINIPAWPDATRNALIETFFDQINAPRECVIYCSGNSCDASRTLAKSIIAMGYSRHIYILTGGIELWKNSGLPVEGESLK